MGIRPFIPQKEHDEPDADADDVNNVENGRDSDVSAGVVHTPTRHALDAILVQKDQPMLVHRHRVRQELVCKPGARVKARLWLC